MTMRTATMSFAAVLATGACVAAEPLMYPETEDASVNFINVEPARSDCAVPAERILLNGKWKFNYVEKPEARPVDFQSENFDDAKWNAIPVPSSWQIQGYGTPIYSSWMHSFKIDPPRVTTDPPEGWTAWRERYAVGYYRRTFDVPEEWLKSGQVFIRFDGVEPAFHLWINGRLVGYAEDSFSSDEFNLTKFLKPGKNLIAVRVPRWCDGSYAEDQDFFRFNGIFRDVTLFHTQDLTIRDLFLRGGLENDYKDGTLAGELFVKNYSGKERTGTVRWSLSRDGKTILSAAEAVSVRPGEEIALAVSGRIPSVAAWTAETPELYRFEATLGDDKVATDVGFRTIEVGPQYQLLVNGREVILKGANRHDTHPDYGRANPVEIVELDLRMMKENNMNTIRTSHYPNAPELYDICNKLGLYVVAEANLECHGYTKLINDPAWERTFVERNLNAFHRLKNNPAIIFWSLGNENGWEGERSNMRAASKAIRALDGTRLIHAYEYKDLDADAIDMGSAMYPTHAELDATGSNGSRKPFFVCEYAHSSANASGSFQEYMDLFEKHPRLIGGCVWQWANCGIRAKYDEKTGFAKAAPFTGRFFAYGGMFGDEPNSGNGCDDGLIFADRTESAKLREVKKVYQYLRFKKISEENGVFRFSVLNKYFHKTLSGATAYAFVTGSEDKPFASFPIPDLKPGESAEFDFRLPAGVANPNVLVMVFDAGRVPEDLIAKGDLANAERKAIAFEFFPGERAVAALPEAKGSLEVVGSGMDCSVKGANFSLAFRNGLPVSYVYDGRTILAGERALEFAIHRAVLDTDRWIRDRGREKIGTMKTVCKSFESKVENGAFSAKGDYETDGGSVKIKWTTEWTVLPNGTVRMRNTIPAFDPNYVLPRLGFVFRLPADFRNVEYLGYGPHENYCDRKTSAWFDLFRTTVEDMIEPYTRAMSYGNRTGTAAVELFDDKGFGFRVESFSKDGFEFSASPWSEFELEAAGPVCRLPPADRKTVLHVDAFQTGVGNASVFTGLEPLKPYLKRIEDRLVFDFLFRPVQRRN